jgi:hypothetical protein
LHFFHLLIGLLLLGLMFWSCSFVSEMKWNAIDKNTTLKHEIDQRIYERLPSGYTADRCHHIFCSFNRSVIPHFYNLMTSHFPPSFKIPRQTVNLNHERMSKSGNVFSLNSSNVLLSSSNFTFTCQSITAFNRRAARWA